MKGISTKNLTLPIFGILTVLLGLLITYTPSHLAKFSETYSPKELGNMYDKSQYTVPNSKKPISDALLYAYSGYEYVNGDNPLRLNAEHLTTGKYIIGFFYFITGLMKFSGMFFVLAIFFAVNFFLYRKTKNLLPVFIFSFFHIVDTNIRYQITGAPLLDIIQLFFWLLHAFCFYKVTKAKKGLLWIFLSGITLGLMASSKMYIPAFLTIFGDTLYVLLNQKIWSMKNLRSLVIVSVVAVITYVATYIVYFVSYGGTLQDFIKSQLWILHFWTDNPVNKVKMIGAAVPLLMFNKYYVWWGNTPVIPYEDWTIMWPITTLITLFSSIGTLFLLIWKRASFWTNYRNSEILLGLSLWIIIFFLYLLNIPISPRYFILLFVPGYILTAFIVFEIYVKYKNQKG